MAAMSENLPGKSKEMKILTLGGSEEYHEDENDSEARNIVLRAGHESFSVPTNPEHKGSNDDLHGDNP